MKLFQFIGMLCMFFLIMVIGVSCKEQLVPEQTFGKEDETTEEAGAESDSGGRKVTFACWNTQTFFDAQCDGTEYTEFQRPEKWTAAMYSKRLDSLCEVMTALNPDIMVLEEIENESVVQDIANRFAGSSWDKKKSWQYAGFAKKPGTAIGCAVFSRLELSALKVHSLDIRLYETKQPASRPLMELGIKCDDKDFTLFVCHWKSKSGGEEETEIWRDWQESVLARRLCDLQSYRMPVVVCGDFNRNAEDFIIIPRKNDGVNMVFRGMGGQRAEASSPWITSAGTVKKDNGSYFYKDSWERIDNIFSCGDIKVSRFQAVAMPPFADEEGKPVSYKMYNESGYSDHLPLKCILTF